LSCIAAPVPYNDLVEMKNRLRHFVALLLVALFPLSVFAAPIPSPSPNGSSAKRYAFLGFKKGQGTQKTKKTKKATPSRKMPRAKKARR